MRQIFYLKSISIVFLLRLFEIILSYPMNYHLGGYGNNYGLTLVIDISEYQCGIVQMFP